MKQRILLLNPPYSAPIIRDNYCCYTSKSGYIWAPVDLLYLSGILKSKGSLIQVIDAVAERQTSESVLNKIKKFQPHFIFCLTGTVSFIEDMNLLATYKQSYSNVLIYVLGNTPCFKPRQFLLEFPFIKGIVHNFFDLTIRNIIKLQPHLSNSCSYRFRKKIYIGKIHNTHSVQNDKKIGAPQYSLFPIHRYSSPTALRRPFITALTSFGCPFRCSFCIASQLEYAKRDIYDLKKEFDAMKKAGIREIFFEDSTFNANKEHVFKICSLLSRDKYQFTWSCNIHSALITPELLRAMKKAGCHTVQIGVESGSTSILLQYSPSKQKEKIEKAISLCKKAGLRTLGYYIVGFPNETKEQINKTIEFAKKLDTDLASFSVLTPDYGTPLYKQVVDQHIYPHSPGDKLTSFDSSSSASVLVNNHITAPELEQLVKKAYIVFYLRPKKILSFLSRPSFILSYIQNGLLLIFKKML